MAVNFPGPYEVDINYEQDGLDHKLRLNCDVVIVPTVGDLPADIDLVTRQGTGIALDVAVDAITDFIHPLFESASVLTTFDFWRYDPLSFSKTYITTGDISKAGTSATHNTRAGQSVYTHRTLEGGIMKVTLMEPSIFSNLVTPYASLGAASQALMDYVCDADTWILGRDTSYPVVPLNLAQGQNEATFRRRYR